MGSVVRRRRTEPKSIEGAPVIEAVRDGIVAFDRAGRITVWNPAAAALTGMAAERMIGRTLIRKAPWLAKADGGKPLAAVLDGMRSPR